MEALRKSNGLGQTHIPLKSHYIETAMTDPSAYYAVSTSRHRSFALWTILTAQLMLQMDFLIVIVALPRIQQDLGFSAATLSWVPNAFALAFGGLLLFGGRLGDMIGQVRAFRLGLAIFVIASLIGGIAQTPLVLILARVLQGIGAALAGPSVLALVTVMARNDAERARGMALFIAVSSIGASAGLILGGALTDFLSWRWSLLINVPFGLVVIALINRLVEETRPKPSRLDIAGTVTATLGSVALVYGFIHAAENGWATIGSALSLTGAIVFFAAFYRIEANHEAPLLDLNLLRAQSRLAALIVMALIVGMHFSLLFMLVQYLQKVLNLSPLMAGLAYVPLTATVFIISHFIPASINKTGPRPLLVVGSLLVAVSLFLFAGLDSSSDYFPHVLVPILIHAAGIALVFAPGTMTIMQGVPIEQAGTASGLLQMDQQIGGAVGIALIAAVYTMGAKPDEFIPGMPLAFYAAGFIALLSALVALLVRAKSSSTNANEKVV